MERRKTRKVNIGNIAIGGDAPITVQSMLSVPAEDISGSVSQAIALEKAGCDIIRAAVPNMEAVKLISSLKENLSIPVVADIHFDYKLALESVAAGVDKIRINPGNIGDESRVKAVAVACKNAGVPIRVGVNSGSLEKHILEKYGRPSAEALFESGMYHIKLLEKFDFDDIVLSLKASDAQRMHEAYSFAAEHSDYPLHLGVTEAGTKRMGIIKSSAAIGGLLLDGIGDTIRVSLTDEPIEEVKAGIDLLKAIGFRNEGIKFVSCPTCGRTKINLIELAKKAEEALENCPKNITVAIMGCVVNGPGEAKDADIGIAGGDGCGMIFKKGEIVKKVNEDELLSALIQEIDKM